MLKTLLIKDYALIESITVEFEKGLNIITGETGAGKSILLGALNLLLGERASVDNIRAGASKAVVEGIFNVEKNKSIKKLCAENEIELEDELIIRREISSKGSGRCFLNDTPVSLTVLKDAGDVLVDLHGQHEHQSLLREELHLDFLDEFCDLENELTVYRKYYSDMLRLKKEISSLRQRETELKRNREIFDYQLKEIEGVAPVPNEDKELSDELNVSENAEQLLEISEEIYGMLYDSDGSVLDILGKAKTELDTLVSIDSSLTPIEEEMKSAMTIIKDIAYFLRDYKNKIDVDPQRLSSLRTRLGALQSLKKKFNTSLDGLFVLKEKLEKELAISENFDGVLKDLELKYKEARITAGKQASKLSERRRKESGKVEKEVVEALKDLGIENAKFEVKFSDKKLSEKNDGVIIGTEELTATSQGVDTVAFYITTNSGVPVKPLSKVASGGEVSRIMLSLKSILAKSDKLPLLVFDEIDTGISGRIAQKVGGALRNLSEFHQIIAITHLPQIAGMSDCHFLVEKAASNGTVISKIRKMDDDEHVREVAKLLSGEEVTQSSLNSALELIDSKNLFNK